MIGVEVLDRSLTEGTDEVVSQTQLRKREQLVLNNHKTHTRLPSIFTLPMSIVSYNMFEVQDKPS